MPTDDDRPRSRQRERDDDEYDERPRSRRRDRDGDDDDDDRPRRRSRRNDEDDDDRPRNRRRDDDDDDDDRPRRRRRDDDDDRPRRKKRSGKGGKTVAIAAGVLIGLALLGGVGYGVYRLASPSGPKAPVPAGWKEYTSRDDNFKAYFPKDPKVDKMGDVMGVGRGGGGFFPGMPTGGSGTVNMYSSGDFNDGVHIEVMVTRIPSGVPSAVREGMSRSAEETQKMVPAGMGFEVRTVKWLGEKGMEVVSPNGVMRSVATDKAIYQASIGGPKHGRAKPAEEAAFFDNFVLTR